MGRAVSVGQAALGANSERQGEACVPFHGLAADQQGVHLERLELYYPFGRLDDEYFVGADSIR
jgi:hypothetical protein